MVEQFFTKSINKGIEFLFGDGYVDNYQNALAEDPKLSPKEILNGSALPIESK
jgi:hypothetical protein